MIFLLKAFVKSPGFFYNMYALFFWGCSGWELQFLILKELMVKNVQLQSFKSVILLWIWCTFTHIRYPKVFFTTFWQCWDIKKDITLRCCCLNTTFHQSFEMSNLITYYTCTCRAVPITLDSIKKKMRKKYECYFTKWWSVMW